MNEPMPDGNSAAELAHDNAQRLAPDPTPHLEHALDELVDQIMGGRRIPHGGRYDAIDLVDFLQAQEDLGELVSPLVTQTHPDARTLAAGEFLRAIEGRLRSHLEGSALVQERAAEIARDKAAGPDDYHDE